MNMPTTIKLGFDGKKLSDALERLCREHVEDNLSEYVTVQMGDAVEATGMIDLAPGEDITFSGEPALKKGELYAGIILGKDGAPNHHLILLAGEKESVSWEDAKKWAKKAGGELPTRREQSLLFANLQEEFTNNWYWSQEQHASYESYAWMQYFGDGDQSDDHKDDGCRARAVRRLAIE